jgi:xanthine dehydrogenase YagS FAD-binding subunit
VAAAADAENGVRIALGGVAHAPWRAERAEAVLRTRPASPEALQEAADAELDAASPLRDNAFKVPLARNVLVRTLSELIA